MKLRNEFLPVATSMYINYIIVGITAVALSLNIEPLMEQMNTNRAGIGFVISAIGIGKFVVLYIAGILSDRFGRRMFIQLGAVSYIVFYIGILFSPNVTVAVILAFLAGCANSFMDAGTYPALMESFPTAQGTANIIVKAFVALGQFAFPLIVGAILASNLYYGYSYILLVAILAINAIFIMKVKFPPLSSKSSSETGGVIQFKDKPNFWIEGLALIFIGFTCSVTFNVVAVWIPTFGQDMAKMGQTASLALVSYYSLGSILAVFITAALVKSLIRPVTFVFVYPLISLVMLLILWMFPSPTITVIASFVIGFAAAGGVLQLTITAMSELFPSGKGKAVGAINSMNSIAFFIGPAITGVLAETNVSNVILFDIIVTAVGVVLGAIVLLRYRKVVDIKATKANLKEAS